MPALQVGFQAVKFAVQALAGGLGRVAKRRQHRAVKGRGGHGRSVRWPLPCGLVNTERECELAQRPEVRVLGLGEPTHGSAEAFTWKGQVLLSLAQTGRLRVLAWECGFASGRRLDAALRGHSQEPLASALRAQGFWCWNTEEILAGLRDLQSWNAAQPPAERVRFVGVDVQPPHVGVQLLVDAGHEAPVLRELCLRIPLNCSTAGKAPSALP
nr:erythromycin esterase family protein [Deinococcus arboris]